MKKEKKIVLIIAMVIAVLASLSALGYALTKTDDMGFYPTGAAATFWGIAYWTAAILTVCSAILGIIFLIKDAIAVRARYLIILGITIVAFIVSYFIASDKDIAQSVFEKAGADYSSSKIVGAGLYTVYILFAGVIVSVVYAEIAKRLK
ncbi:MAG: hypothetical protein IJ748_00025 [Bacteroidales bacterium]|nr:hypothetical protein [Bacteroidales bacterium]